MSIDLFQPLILALSPFILAAYICRLTMLSFKTDRPIIILFHMCMPIATGWAAYRAYLGEPQFGDLATVIAAGCWIIISYGSWKHGVPGHHSKHPGPLNTEDWIKVHGGRKQ